MAFPTPGTQVDTDFATSVTSMAVNMPATVNSGDLLLSFVSVRNAGTWNTIPTGWVKIAEQAGGGSVGETSVFYKIADGTEDGTTPTWITSTATSAAWQVMRVTSWHGTTPPEVAVTSGDATAANPPNLAPSFASEDILWVVVAGHSAASAAAFTAAPTNYTNFANNGASSGGAACSIASASRQLNAASENPGTFTAGGSNRWWASATIAVRPAAAAGSSVKTIDGLAYASVKTVNGLAIASVSKINGL